MLEPIWREEGEIRIDTCFDLARHGRFMPTSSQKVEHKLFSWFSTKQAKALGLELASIVAEHVPNDASLADKKRQSKVNYAKDKMQKRIRQFKQEEVLSFFKTAKLLNEFKWALRDAGYSKEFGDSFSSWVFIGLRTQNF